jgi:DNA-binding transcriptional LysR family regulator
VDLNLLSHFVAVAEASSFSAAARKLGRPTSSVSRAIASLEADMGVKLLYRTTRKVALSRAGQTLLERVAPLLGSLRRSLDDLPDREEQPSGQLRITASVDFGATVLADIVARFLVRYPAITVEVRLTSDVVDLVADSVDLALRISTRRLKDSSLLARRASAISLGLFASPTYLARRTSPRQPSELGRHEWVVFQGAGPLRLEGPDGVATVPVRGRMVCDDMSFVREAVRAGAGIGVLPRFLADSDVVSGHLVRVLPRWNTRSGYLWIVCPSGSLLPPKVVAFRAFLLTTLKGRSL